MYSWPALVLSEIAVEIPFSLLAVTVYFVCWYWGAGLPRDLETCGLAFLFTIAAQPYYVSFGQALAGVSPNAYFAGMLFTLLFQFVALLRCLRPSEQTATLLALDVPCDAFHVPAGGFRWTSCAQPPGTLQGERAGRFLYRRRANMQLLRRSVRGRGRWIRRDVG